MLFQVLLAAYGNTRKEEVTSVGVFHRLQRCQVCGVPSYRQKVSCGGKNSRTAKTEDRVRVWDINDDCAKRMNRRIEEMTTLDSQPSSVVLTIGKSDQCRHPNIQYIRNQIIIKKSY